MLPVLKRSQNAFKIALWCMVGGPAVVLWGDPTAPKDNIFDWKIAVGFMRQGFHSVHPDPLESPIKGRGCLHGGGLVFVFPQLRSLRCGPVMILESREAHSRSRF